MLVILEEAAAPDDAVGTVQPASRPALPQAGALSADVDGKKIDGHF